MSIRWLSPWPWVCHKVQVDSIIFWHISSQEVRSLWAPKTNQFIIVSNWTVPPNFFKVFFTYHINNYGPQELKVKSVKNWMTISTDRRTTLKYNKNKGLSCSIGYEKRPKNSAFFSSLVEIWNFNLLSCVCCWLQCHCTWTHMVRSAVLAFF